MIDSSFISSINNNTKYNLEEIYYEYALFFYKMDYLLTSFRKNNIEKSIASIKKILREVNYEYLSEFEKMLNEDNCDNPYIIIYDSTSCVSENESQCFNSCISFFKTDTIADISLLLHEYTHYLVNGKNKEIKPFERETLPILSEFLVCDYIKDNTFLKSRLNNIIYEAKSLLCKVSIMSGFQDVSKLFKKYNFNSNDIKRFSDDLLFNKSLSCDGEIKYINGFVSALLLNNEDIYKLYFNLVNDISYIDALLKEYTTSLEIEKTLTKNLKSLKNML